MRTLIKNTSFSMPTYQLMDWCSNFESILLLNYSMIWYKINVCVFEHFRERWPGFRTTNSKWIANVRQICFWMDNDFFVSRSLEQTHFTIPKNQPCVRISRKLLRRFRPTLDIIEWLALCDVVDEQRSYCSAIICTCDRSIPPAMRFGNLQKEKRSKISAWDP